MFDSSQQFSTGTQYTGTVLFLMLAIASPLSAIFLAQGTTSFSILISLAISFVFCGLAFAQWKWRSQLSIPSIASQNKRPK